MGTPKVEPDKIHLQKIRILKADFKVDEDLMDTESGVVHFKVDLKSEPGFNLPDQMMRFRLNVRLTGYDEESEPVGVTGEYCIDFIYMIENLEDFISMEEDGENFGVDEDLGATIAGISYSTARGIILDRTQHTDFNGAILPVINPYELLERKE